MNSIKLEIAEGIATVTLDRPPVNAVDNPTMKEIAEVFNSFADNKEVRVAIFTAAGDRAFMAGVDLNSIGAQAPEDLPISTLTDSGQSAETQCGQSPIVPCL